MMRVISISKASDRAEFDEKLSRLSGKPIPPPSKTVEKLWGKLK